MNKIVKEEVMFTDDTFTEIITEICWTMRKEAGEKWLKGDCPIHESVFSEAMLMNAKVIVALIEKYKNPNVETPSAESVRQNLEMNINWSRKTRAGKTIDFLDRLVR